MKLFKHKVLPGAVGAALAGISWGAPVFAEEQRSATKSDQALQTVVVTAQKREETIQSVPLAISVVTGDQVQSRGILTSNEIGRLAPNVSGQLSGGRGDRPRWFIRGIGSNDPSLTAESPIGIYQDEVFTSLTSLQSFPLFDLERVEILRGPQGTLWGKNTTGGAINFISRKPSYTPDGYVTASLGDWGAKTTQGAFGGGLSDKLAARVSFFHEEYDGYARNLSTGDDGPEVGDSALRLQLLADVSDELQALVNLHARRRDTGPHPTYWINTEAGGADRNGWVPDYGTSPRSGDDYYGGDGDNVDNLFGGLVKLDWQLGDLTLTSISAYDTGNSDSDLVSAIQAPVVTGQRDRTASRSALDNWQISQEFRLASDEAQRLSWIAGLHYFRYRFDSDSAAATFEPVARRTYSRTWMNQDAESYAAFGSLKFAVTERFDLNAGLRWTEEEKSIDIHTIRSAGATFGDPGYWWNPGSLDTPLSYDERVAKSRKWRELSGDFTPEYRLTDDALVYFRFARGYRSGGFNNSIPVLSAGQIAAGLTPDIPVVEPEYLNNYELGLKTSWLNDRLHVNANLFYYDQKDIQLNIQAPNPLNLQNPPSGSFAQNAASGEVKGFELEVHAAPLENLRVSGSIGLIQAEYVDFNPTLSVSGVTQQVDRSGNKYFRTPERTATLDLEYRIPFQAGSLILGTDWNYRSHQYYNAAQQGAAQGDVGRAADGSVYVSGQQEQDGYVIGNARVSWLTRDEKLEFFSTVTNLTDEHYVINSRVPTPNYPVQTGAPRFYNVGVTARF
ncbi:TonB-dependent receptor [Phytopseudomonas dryadis]|uniref:TonB-dependent receptor n=1 Tax=Phytopseudomonas dryadis TaxID=2487520 RepID=A0A4Q9R5D8_9GAMM|nr:TonB-dependent receptor [Pseudomonas dryadis]TBU94003.1 TonB-dependent receptor [Pseudomonas dryadis]